MESVISHESMGKKGGKRLDKRCRIHVHSRTARLADPDGRSVKAAIDGLCVAGILADDSAEYIESVSQSQEAVKDGEETIIDIMWDQIEEVLR